MILAKVLGNTEITTNMLPLNILNKMGSKIIQMDAETMSMSLRQARRMFEHRYLQEQMNRFGNNSSKVARFIGMERSTLYRKSVLWKSAQNC
jgi:two-component system nitrogen regulation response regulator NtrX